jgi:putative transposase
VKVNRVDEVIYLPKVGWVKAMFHRPFQEGDVIKQVIVSKTETGKYFASLSLDNSKEAPEKADDLCENDVLGIDLGITDLMVASDGTKVPNPRFIKRAAKNLRRKQQSLSRKKKGSANRAKARLAVARAHERLANVRRDFQHKLSRQIVDESQAVVCETLKVKNMMKNRKLAKSIGDASWFSFVSKLEYKLEWAGKRLVKLDQWFPGSKTCSNCQTIVNKMPLDMRHWDCLSCGASHDRDINAALNHKAKGIEILKAEGLFVSAC